MKRVLLIFLFLLIIVPLSVSCDVPMRIRYQLNPPEPGEILLFDDFTVESSWEVWSDGFSVVDYDSGGLRFFVNQADFVYWSSPAQNFYDTLISVSALKVSGPDDNSFGVFCRYQNRDNFYYFIISSDGYYGIMKVLDGNHQLLSSDQLEFSELILQGDGQKNQILAECSGPNLVLTVNNTMLAVASDSDFAWGGVGLIVGTYDQVGVDILFDDFQVVQP